MLLFMKYKIKKSSLNPTSNVENYIYRKMYRKQILYFKRYTND